MMDYGVAPAADEIEVTVFGPGLGEAVAIHLGEGKWVLVDSCEVVKGAGPVAAEYLDFLGVSTHQIGAIIATHWHDDHVRAISKLVEKYEKATFFMSGVLREAEARAFLAAYGGNAAPAQTGGTKELVTILQSPCRVRVANSQTCMVDSVINGRNVKLYALSPHVGAYQKAAAHLAQYLPKAFQPVNKAPPEPSPNAAAVVLHIDFGGEAVLLGADMEDNGTWGWTALIDDPWTMERTPAGAYKVAHHGSSTGDSPRIWEQLLRQEPVVCVTPFIQGRHNLPTAADRERLRSKTPLAYISSDASRKPAIEREQLKRLNAICSNIRRLDTGSGAVRMRKRLDSSLWKVETFGSARKL